jgi:hypothetical protein
MAKRESVDRERLRQALQKSTSTAHVLVPNWKQSENEQQSQLRRARVPAPTGRKLNSANNAAAKKAAKTMTPAATAATYAQSGVGIKTTEAFGVKPVGLL